MVNIGKFGKRFGCRLAWWVVCGLLWTHPVQADKESDYYRVVTIASSKAPTVSRSKYWKPAPKGLALEVSGIAILDEDRIAVSIRKGEIWIIGGLSGTDGSEITYRRFASALHEPLGLVKRGSSLFTVQRSELTEIRDSDGDGVADEYLTVARGWGVTGNYHEYAFGPKLDRDGNFWLTLNLGLGLKPDQKKLTITNRTLGVSQGRWRGWGMKVTPDGQLIPVCAGMRSPCGLGANRAGDMFYTDQQGNWVGTNTLHHMRAGAFFHHPEALASIEQPESPIRDVASVPNGVPFPDAVQQLSILKPPAVWFPYKKIGQSATDIMLDDSGGSFGPFDGQLFVGEFTLASINRVFLEKVEGQYQGACFPFREGFASAVLRMTQAADGRVYVGVSNRGWSSLGTAAYGLQRLEWTGRTPFEIQEMKARRDGFELKFTKPVDRESAGKTTSYHMSSHTYLYHSTYGSPEIQLRNLRIRSATVSADGRSVTLKVDGLRKLFVHSLSASGIRDRDGNRLLHDKAYYTLNRIP